MRLIYTETGQQLIKELYKDSLIQTLTPKSIDSALLQQRTPSLVNSQESRASPNYMQSIPEISFENSQFDKQSSTRAENSRPKMLQQVFSLPKIQPKTQEAIDASDFLFKVKVKRAKIKVSPKFEPIYEKLRIEKPKNVWNQYGYSPMQAKSSLSQVQSQKNIHETPSINFVSQNDYMVGSLKLDEDDEDPILALKKKDDRYLHHYPSVTEDILSHKIVPEKLKNLSIEKITGTSKVVKPKNIVLKSLETNKNAHPNLYEVEIGQNRIGKTLVKQQKQEQDRMKVVQKINERSDQLKKFLKVDPLKELKQEEKKELEKMLNSRYFERYKRRLIRWEDKRYGKFWQHHKFQNLAGDYLQREKLQQNYYSDK